VKLEKRSLRLELEEEIPRAHSPECTAKQRLLRTSKRKGRTCIPKARKCIVYE
jgi:hypothetical protein